MRPLAWRDWPFCWRLANDPDVRTASFNQSPPTILGHMRWMKKWTNVYDMGKLAWVAEIAGGEKVGLFRAENSPPECVVSIAVLPSYRGQGVGEQLLRGGSRAVQRLYRRPLTAYVKRENVGSLKLFEKCGYQIEDGNLVLVLRRHP